MRRILAITWLTWKAALRFRLFWVLAGLLALTVFCLPLVLKDDGTARGFIQILLAYNLTVITALLGLATLWLACGSLARDIEECQIQVVAVKPIARWQIWLGKWLGIMLLDALLLALSGFAVYSLLLYRAARLPEKEQTTLNNEIFVARAGLREPITDHSAEIEKIVGKKLKENTVNPVDPVLLRKQVQEQVKAIDQVVPPNFVRKWEIDLGLRTKLLRHVPLFVRSKFFVGETNSTGTYMMEWRVGPPNSSKEASKFMSMAADTFLEFEIPPDLFDDKGKLTVQGINRSPVALFFPTDDGMEVLYREAGFGLNFARGLGVILCWLGLLAALGLFAASLLSFPVAAFLSLTLLLVGFSSGSLEQILDQRSVLGNINPSTAKTDHETVFDVVMLAVFRELLQVVKIAEAFSPVDSLSSGRSITWFELGRAFSEVVLLLGGSLGVAGVLIFNRRELATAQGVS